MSRQPAADKKESIRELLSMANVVDFVDNSVTTGGALQAGVTPGPPSFLQAHGIKYVPAVSVGELGDRYDPSGEGEEGMVSMSQNAQSRQRVVTQADLNERVNQQVANYMRGGGGVGAQEGVPAGRDPVLDRLRSLQAEMERSTKSIERGVGSRDAVSDRIQELRSRMQTRAASYDPNW